MNDSDIKIYYSDLLILQYKGKPKAKSTVEANIASMIDGQILSQIENSFDLETAMGAQLDIIGKYVGVDRFGNSFTSAVTLNDDDFRKLIKMKIIINSFNSSLSETQDLIDLFFKGMMYVFDYKDMSISYFLDASFGSQELVEVFINKNMLPSPMGVGLGGTVYNIDLTFFGFRDYNGPNDNAYPFNNYNSYNTSWTWLSYAHVVNSPVSIDYALLTESGIKLLTEDGREILI